MATVFLDLKKTVATEKANTLISGYGMSLKSKIVLYTAVFFRKSNFCPFSLYYDTINKISKNVDGKTARSGKDGIYAVGNYDIKMEDVWNEKA